MTTGLFNQVLLRFRLVFLLLGLWLPLTAFGQAHQLGEFLDGQGRLAIPAGFSGSLDPSGFEMTTAADGTPRFVAQGSIGNVVQGDWEGFGGVNFGCNGEIDAMAIDVSGRVYLGGFFTVCGETATNRIAVYDPLTNQFRGLESNGQNGVNSSVSALAVSGSDVYVGGFFTEAGGQPANRVARWDGNAWHALESGGQNGVNGLVFALAVADNDVL